MKIILSQILPDLSTPTSFDVRLGETMRTPPFVPLKVDERSILAFPEEWRQKPETTRVYWSSWRIFLRTKKLIFNDKFLLFLLHPIHKWQSSYLSLPSHDMVNITILYSNKKLVK